MAYIGPVARWDIFRADLEPGVGHEKGLYRPVIVVSNDGFNAHFRMATVLPVTKLEGKRRRIYAFEALLPKGTLTAGHASIVMAHQIRSISTMRLVEKIGALRDPGHQREIEDRMLEHLGIAFEAEGIE